MGGGTRETKTIQNPYEGLPQWVKDYYKRDIRRTEENIAVAEPIRDWLAENPRVIMDMSPHEKAAVARVLQQGDESGLMLDDARDMIGGDMFESAYTDDVVDTTLEGMQREAARNTVLRGASEAAVGGLGGTRGAVADALAQELTGRNMAEMEAKLRDQAHRFGVDSGFTGAGLLADLSTADMDRALKVASTQGSYGAMERELEQAQADAERTAGRDAHSWFTDVFNASRQLPATGGGTQTKTEPGPGLFSQLLGGAATAAGIWAKLSDVRAKDDIEVSDDDALDKLRDLSTYSYRYKPGYGHTPERTSGLMAQDLERSGIPGAVHERPDGMKEVDPYPVLATVVAAVRELDDRTRANQGLET